MADDSQDKAFAAIDAFIETANIDRSSEGWKTQLPTYFGPDLVRSGRLGAACNTSAHELKSTPRP